MTGAHKAHSEPGGHKDTKLSYLKGPHCRATREPRRHLAGGPVDNTTVKGGQQVRQPKVCHKHPQRVQAVNQEVGRSKVSVQDAQSVQVH